MATKATSIPAWILILACILAGILIGKWATSPRVEYEELIDIEEEMTDDK